MRPSRISVDERGAILFIALFFAIFALGLLYLALGVAEAALFREKMQDAADSTALSSAILHARGMNLIVLINIVMAALLAILVTIKLIEGLAIVGMGFATALSFPTFGASLAAIPPLHTVQSEMEGLYRSTKPPIFDALEVLHDLADAVKAVAPLAAEASAMSDARFWKPEVQTAIVIPPSLTLPVEDDTFKKLCAEAGALPAGIAENALRAKAGKAVFHALGGAISDITESLSAWFCGDDGKAPKPYSYSTDPTYPAPDPACASKATSEDCAVAEATERQASPDPGTGACRATTDCSLGGPYDERVRQARIDCDPSSSNPPEKYIYQERTGTVSYVWTTTGWRRSEPNFRTAKLVESSEAPCAPRPYRASVDDTYNTVVRESTDVNDVEPVCTTERVPLAPGFAPGETRTISFTEVTHLLGCQKHVTHTVNLDVSGGNAQSAGTSSKSPKRVLSGAALGDEHFQIRSIAKGSFSTLEADGVFRLALWGAPEPPDPLAPLAALGTFAVAQAEYFYDGSDGPGAWMWNMRWRARLRRFRMPESSVDAIRAACGGLTDRLAALSELIAH